MAGEDVLIGQVVGEYRLVSLVGRGAFGAVYLGQHSSLPSLRVAVKVAHRALAGDQDFVAALRAECASLPFLKHENVATFMQFVSEGPLAPALVLELVEGGSLETRLQQGKQDPAKVWRWLEELLGGLSAAHARGLVHRDIKPGNVLLTDKGSVRLVDFGLARAAERGSSNTATSLAGTLEYVAPEVANGDTASPAADVYAVGLLCWEMLMGERACLGGKAGAPAAKILWHVTKGPEALGPRANGLGIPANLAGLVDELCAKEVGRRPANAAAALARLHTVRMVGVGAGTPGPESVGRVPLSVAPAAGPATPPVSVGPRIPPPPRPNRGPVREEVRVPADIRQGPSSVSAQPVSPDSRKAVEREQHVEEGKKEVGPGPSPGSTPRIPPPPRPPAKGQGPASLGRLPSSNASPPAVGQKWKNAGVAFLSVGSSMFLLFASTCYSVYNLQKEREMRQYAEMAMSGLKVVGGTTWVGKAGYAMRGVPSGTYTLGCTAGQRLCDEGQGQHTVTLTHPFYIGEAEVTQTEYLVLMDATPSEFFDCLGPCPVENVSWVDAVRYANALSKVEGFELCYEIVGNEVRWPKGANCEGYRLPTEAEWEVAARAGKDLLFSGSDNLDEVGWHIGNSGGRTHPVKGKAPNAYGLYDMSGNVWEWLWDGVGELPEHSVDPAPAGDGAQRANAGGSWDGGPDDARVSGALWDDPNKGHDDLGFRLVRSIL